ncbi:tyrosine-type recombinase/integrase [Celerinatantimonas sp. MCCC 1A17872]|uniref:tyrosine-type recombinase/integrase n=1 Tax=Celerinatantimonas sp. MCCC 1A17872 TaxID=3177514 RepID=UPI0038C0CF3D
MALYISSKSGIWQFRYQIPPRYRHLFSNRYEIKKSLRTSDKQEAKVLSLELESRIRRKVFEMESDSITIEKFTKTMLTHLVGKTSERIISIINPISDDASFMHEDIMGCLQEAGDENYAETASIVGFYKDEFILDTVYDLNQSLEEQVQDYFATRIDTNEYMPFTLGSTEYWMLVQTIKQCFKIFKDIRIALEDNDVALTKKHFLRLVNYVESTTGFSPISPLVDEVKTPIQIQTAIVQPPQISITNASNTTSSKSVSIKFSQAITKFVQSKRDEGVISAKSLNDYTNRLNVICDLLDNPSIDNINRTIAENVRNLLRKYPSNKTKFKEFNGLKGKAILDRASLLRSKTLSPSSVKSYLEKCSTLFKWLCLHEYITRNPFESIKVNDGTGRKHKISDERPPWNEEQLNKLFSSPIYTNKEFKHPYYYWLPLLGLFTGARLNEICQLYVADVTCKTGIWCIHITDQRSDQKIKNANSERVLPIHSKLIELGFLEYIDSLDKNGRVFPELNYQRDGYSTAAGKWFSRYKERCGIEQKIVFHSFRHTVATELKQAGIASEKAAAMLGHGTGTITYDRYGKAYHPEIVADVVESLSFPATNQVLKW